MRADRPAIFRGADTDARLVPGGSVRLLAASRAVTPAMSLARLDDLSVIVDCGADPVADGAAPIELSDEVLEADAVVLTHGHLDHVGGLPALIAAGFSSPIVATAATLAVARIVLCDAIRLRGGERRDTGAFLAAFDRLARPVALGSPFRPFSRSPLEVTLHEAGHILGSASVELSTPSARLLFSGDLGRPRSPILRDYNTEWRAERPFDLVVMETTYGAREHEHDAAAVREELLRIVQRALEDGGHILVPAFAVGRTQALIYHLDCLVESGRLRALPVAVDSPMGLRVTETYSAFSRLFDEEALDKLSRRDDPLDFEGLYAVRGARDSRRLREIGRSVMIIAGSGMCTGGRIVDHLLELLDRPETDVLFVGYQAPGTTGRAIIDAANRARGGVEQSVRLRGREVPVRAAVDQLHGLSAHADRIELAAWLDAIPSAREVLLHHGDPASQETFAKWYEAR